ncbi:MAG TPA: acetate kinase [Longimicrobiales bacterium]|nr:acetate kinase [Longimicrobiales bacterium]
MNVLVLNAGSSTLKFQLIRTDKGRMAEDADQRLARGIVERIGGEAVLRLEAGEQPERVDSASIRDLRGAVDWVLRWMAGEGSGVDIDSLASIDAAGHRVVHGGEHFRHSVLIDAEVLRQIEATIELAPLHNPHNLRGIQAVRDTLGPALPQAAVFDTAFHHTLPEHAYLYGIPYSLYRRYRIRRYGFHGTSHRYVAWRWRKLTGRERSGSRLVTFHLGNGASACAIRDGDSVDTSMGFTPLEGLVMGTRAGDLDPAILDYVAAKEGLGHAQLDTLLNKQSGLLGISGLTHDMRELLEEAREHDDRRARLAVELFSYRARKYLGAYLAVLGGADAVVLTGGIGENAALVRERILHDCEWLGIELDPDANAATVGGATGRITREGSRVAVWVIPTDEELLIARDTVRLVTGEETRY